MKVLLVWAWLAGAIPGHPVAPPATSAAAMPPQQVSPAQVPAHGGMQIHSSSDVADPMFGIHARAVGLERIVHVLQWHRNAAAAGGYDQVWSSERIGPEGLDRGHANPEFPINGQRWWSPDASIEGHPVSTGVLTAVEAEADANGTWETIKPDLSQLPANLAVTFQPDGERLTTSQDAAHPQVGDVEVRWRALTSPTVPSGVQLIDGRLEMAVSGAVAEASPAPSSTPQAAASNATDDARAWLQRLTGGGIGWLVVAGVVLAILALVLRRRRPRRRR